MCEEIAEDSTRLLQYRIHVESVVKHNAEVGVCGICMDVRGITEGESTERTRRSTLEQLTDWTVWADKVITL